MEFVGFGVFFLIWGALFFGSFAGLICAVAALISVSQTDDAAFGPWWDNVKTQWLLGIAVSFIVPFGSLVTGVYWFWKGRPPIRTTGVALRPFWAGPPKPMPQWPPAGYQQPYMPAPPQYAPPPAPQHHQHPPDQPSPPG